MESNEIVQRLRSFNKRLGTLADQVHELREQAQHTLDRMYLLREDIEQLERLLRANAERELTNSSLPRMER
jgi:hypothetical protein